MNQSMINRLKKMQKDMLDAQKRLEESIFTGTAGGGLVKVEVYGNKEVLSVDINEDILNKDDKEMIEDTIVAALNDAFRQVDEETQDVMSEFQMPGMF
jgi:hypothetical protein